MRGGRGMVSVRRQDIAMLDETFIYWDNHGNRHEVPIIQYLIPAGMKLGPARIRLRARSEDMQAAKECNHSEAQCNETGQEIPRKG